MYVNLSCIVLMVDRNSKSVISSLLYTLLGEWPSG